MQHIPYVQHIPYDVLFNNVFPYCDIDIKLAFKVPPRKLTQSIKFYEPISLKTFELIAISHLQTIKRLYNWNIKLDELFKYFNILEVNKSFLTMKLLVIPQYKIIYGKNWRSNIILLPGVDIDYIHFINEPDISIYESLYQKKII